MYFVAWKAGAISENWFCGCSEACGEQREALDAFTGPTAWLKERIEGALLDLGF